MKVLRSWWLLANHAVPARPPSALDTLVDLALVETTQPSSSSSLDLLTSLEGGTGSGQSRALTVSLPALSRSWVQVLLGDPVDTAASGSTAPRLLTDPPVVRCPTPVIMSPAAAVEAAFAPPPVEIVEVTTSTEAQPQVATGFDSMMSEAAGPGPSLPTDRLLPSEDELGNIFTSSEDDSIAGPALVPPGPTATRTRHTLQPRDVVWATNSVFSRVDAQALVPTILRTFATSLSTADLTECLEWLWLMHRDVATRALDVALRGRLLRRPDECTLSEVIRLLEMFAADIE